MTEFWEQTEQKIDMSDVREYKLSEYPFVSIKYNTTENRLHRTITLKEIIENFGFDISLQEVIAQLKIDYLIFDVKYLQGLGYKEIYYKDLAPGSTSIAYDLRVGDFKCQEE